jgi:hypothetical protein
MRTKTYIAFDGDADLMCYRTIQQWSAEPKNSFSLNNAHDLNYARDDSLPQSIIAQLHERLDASKHLVLIVGQSTNRNRKGILQYEIRYALRYRLPIILVFKSFSTAHEANNTLWQRILFPKLPSVLREWSEDEYCVICPFTFLAVTNAIKTYSHVNLPAKGYSWFWK